MNNKYTTFNIPKGVLAPSLKQKFSPVVICTNMAAFSFLENFATQEYLAQTAVLMDLLTNWGLVNANFSADLVPCKVQLIARIK